MYFDAMFVALHLFFVF